jgi:hypothetical protein
VLSEWAQKNSCQNAGTARVSSRAEAGDRVCDHGEGSNGRPGREHVCGRSLKTLSEQDSVDIRRAEWCNIGSVRQYGRNLAHHRK